MNLVTFHCWGRSRYDFCQLCSCRNRPGPHNGSGDSPRPPFLSEFVNQIGEFFLVRLIYHLPGSFTTARIHAHIERCVLPKTKSSVRLIKLKAIYEQLETITDKCEDVANIIEGIVLENA